MYDETVMQFANLAQDKQHALRQSPLAFATRCLMAGAYVGIGIVLIFSVGAALDPSWQKLVMGASFGIALILVVFAGAELFTGHTMYMVFGWLRGLTGARALAQVWTTSWTLNLVGSFALASLFVAGGGGGLSDDAQSLLMKTATYKMNSPALELLARAVLCNWLVCLALWMAARTANDAAKCIVISLCLFAFIASGFEHSVANMTLLSIALLGEHPEAVTVAGMFYNPFWVTLGNILGGSLLMGVGYWLASGSPSLQRVPPVDNTSKSC